MRTQTLFLGRAAGFRITRFGNNNKTKPKEAANYPAALRSPAGAAGLDSIRWRQDADVPMARKDDQDLILGRRTLIPEVQAARDTHDHRRRDAAALAATSRTTRRGACAASVRVGEGRHRP